MKKTLRNLVPFFLLLFPLRVFAGGFNFPVPQELLTTSTPTFSQILNGSGYVISHATNSFVVSITSGTGWDSLAYCIGRADESSLTITKVYAESLTASSTVQYRLEERAKGAGASAGTNIFTVTESSANAQTTETSFSNSGIASNAGIFFVTDASASAGTPATIDITVYYKWDN